jgi:hypothetical protein
MLESKSKIKDVTIDPKRDLYKDLSKKVERYRHLPKIKFNSRDLSANESQNAYHSIDYGSRGRFELS